jgi:hypothetical protein
MPGQRIAVDRAHLAVCSVLLIGCLACSDTTAEPGDDTAVVNEALDIGLEAVPPPFAVALNEAETLELVTADGSGRVDFRVGPAGQYPNLKAEAESYGRAFAQRPVGEYHGSLELGTHWGTAYYSRGSWQAEGARREELRIFALHPEASDRLLEVTYLYPAGEGQERVSQLFGVLAQVLVQEPEPAPEERDGP